MFPELTVALVAFLGLVIAWVALPVRSSIPRKDDRTSEADPA